MKKAICLFLIAAFLLFGCSQGNKNLKKAREAANKGNYEEAEKYYKLSIEKTPEDKIALLELAQIYMDELYKSEEIGGLYEKAKSLKPYDEVVERELSILVEKVCARNRVVLFDAINKYLLDCSTDISDIENLIKYPGIDGWEGPYLKEVPHCPDGGFYMIDGIYADGLIKVRCSRHGSKISF